jgi:hypothetical protein
MPWTSQAILKGATGATGPAGGVFGSVIADFGNADNGGADAMSVTVTVAASWLTSTSYPIVELVSGADHLDADDLTSEEVYAFVTNIQVGTSFDVEVFAPNGTQGQWLVNWGAAITGSNDPTKASTSTLISAGDGLTGGGSLAANRSLAVDGTVVRTSSLWTPSSDGIISGAYNRIQLVDHFLYPLATVSVSSLLAADPIPWNANILAGGASIVTGTFGQDIFNKVYGQWGMFSGNTTTSGIWIYAPSIVPGLGPLNLYFRVAFTVPTAAQNTNLFFGLVDSLPSYSNLISLVAQYNSNPCWSGYTMAATVATQTTLATSPAFLTPSSSALSFYKLQVSINAAWTSVTYFVNGNLVATSTLNIPSSPPVVLYPAIGAIKTAGTTGGAVYLDYFALDYLFNTPL